LPSLRQATKAEVENATFSVQLAHSSGVSQMGRLSFLGVLEMKESVKDN